MKQLTMSEIDGHTEKALAAIGVLVCTAGLIAGTLPRVSIVMLVLLALALVGAAVWSEMARKDAPDKPDYSDSDSHLADVVQHLPVVHEQEQQA